mgnify:CR=1 FL=1
MSRSLAICRDLADLLEYPGPRLSSRIEACISRLEALDPGAAELVKDFQRAVGEKSAGEIEEAYTSAFDMKADRCLYVGHQLFGEDRRRNLFLALLNEHYQARGYSSGQDLPDYLPAMLRFAAEHERDAETEELIVECVIPALRKMAAPDGFYTLPLRAVLRLLTGEAA